MQTDIHAFSGIGAHDPVVQRAKAFYALHGAATMIDHALHNIREQKIG
jgi:hypothetical protein